jgi:hypothetical protein
MVRTLSRYWRKAARTSRGAIGGIAGAAGAKAIRLCMGPRIWQVRDLYGEALQARKVPWHRRGVPLPLMAPWYN